MNILEMRESELVSYWQRLISQRASNQAEAALQTAREIEAIRAELEAFGRRVNAVLERFEPACYRSLAAVLRSIPDGDFDYLFTTWLAELRALNVLTEAQAAVLLSPEEG